MMEKFAVGIAKLSRNISHLSNHRTAENALTIININEPGEVGRLDGLVSIPAKGKRFLSSPVPRPTLGLRVKATMTCS
jgi:hypothetical protein